jgi:hypothetical protein
MERPVAGTLIWTALLAGTLVAGCVTRPVAPTAAPTATGVPSTVPSSSGTPALAEPSESFSAEFIPPDALCPPPDVAIAAPTMTVALKGGPARPADMGSSAVTTCSTVGTDDRVPPEPKAPLLAKPGDVLVFTIAPGWRILAWESSDRPRKGEGIKVVPMTVRREQPTSIEVLLRRPGDSIVGVDAWSVGAGGRAIAHVSAVAWVRLSS